MLNREEYNETFNCNLTEEEFEKVMGQHITDDDILNGRVDKLTFCDKQGHKQEFARVVKGEWVEEDDYEYGENAWRCSVCGEPYILIEGTPKQNKYYFCPNCGADMRGEKYE